MGNPITSTLQDGLITVQSCVGDVSGDGHIDIVDVQTVAGRYGAVTGGASYDPRYDLNGDGTIDIVDVQTVAGRYGQACTSSATLPGVMLVATITPTILMVPPASLVKLGDLFTVTVWAQDVSNLGAFDITVNSNPTLASIDSVVLGPLLTSSGRTPFLVTQTISNTTGQVHVVYATLGSDPPGPNGAGALLYIRYRALVLGTLPLTFGSTQLTDVLGNPEPATTVPGTIDIVGDWQLYLPTLIR
ncbi:MAG: hypothetical protein HYR71_12145 [Chloroflexi bacterium]|nr:hypothetical protein [Chloroflexota bacterium]